MRNRLGILSLAIAAAVAASALLVSGCATGAKPPATEIPEHEAFDPYAPVPSPPHYSIRRGDMLSVHFLYNPELSIDRVPVREDGKISLPVIGDVAAVDRSPERLTEDVRRRYLEYVEESGYGTYLRAGDEIQLRFTYNPQLNQRAYVRPDGGVSLLMIGDLQADGIPFAEFEQTVREGYAQYIQGPELSIFLLSTNTRRIFTEPGDITVLVHTTQPKQVFVGGEVMMPKVIEFRDWLTPWQAIMQANGLTDRADPRRAIYITRDEQGRAVTTKLDLSAYVHSGYRNTSLLLRHGDLLIIPRTGIAKLNLFVEQYIRNTLPISTSLSFSYYLNRRGYILD